MIVDHSVCIPLGPTRVLVSLIFGTLGPKINRQLSSKLSLLRRNNSRKGGEACSKFDNRFTIVLWIIRELA
jgi:hypothetical protein